MTLREAIERVKYSLEWEIWAEPPFSPDTPSLFVIRDGHHLELVPNGKILFTNGLHVWKVFREIEEENSDHDFPKLRQDFRDQNIQEYIFNIEENRLAKKWYEETQQKGKVHGKGTSTIF